MLILQIIAGTMPKRGRLEVIVDADVYAIFATEKARSHRNTWDQIGEIVVKELDFSQITLRMNENDANDKPDVFAELTVQTKSLLESAFVRRCDVTGARQATRTDDDQSAGWTDVIQSGRTERRRDGPDDDFVAGPLCAFAHGN